MNLHNEVQFRSNPNTDIIVNNIITFTDGGGLSSICNLKIFSEKSTDDWPSSYTVIKGNFERKPIIALLIHF